MGSGNVANQVLLKRDIQDAVMILKRLYFILAVKVFAEPLYILKALFILGITIKYKMKQVCKTEIPKVYEVQLAIVGLVLHSAKRTRFRLLYFV